MFCNKSPIEPHLMWYIIIFMHHLIKSKLHRIWMRTKRILLLQTSVLAWFFCRVMYKDINLIISGWVLQIWNHGHGRIIKNASSNCKQPTWVMHENKLLFYLYFIYLFIFFFFLFCKHHFVTVLLQDHELIIILYQIILLLGHDDDGILFLNDKNEMCSACKLKLN